MHISLASLCMCADARVRVCACVCERASIWALTGGVRNPPSLWSSCERKSGHTARRSLEGNNRVRKIKRRVECTPRKEHTHTHIYQLPAGAARVLREVRSVSDRVFCSGRRIRSVPTLVRWLMSGISAWSGVLKGSVHEGVAESGRRGRHLAKVTVCVCGRKLSSGVRR